MQYGMLRRYAAVLPTARPDQHLIYCSNTDACCAAPAQPPELITHQAIALLGSHPACQQLLHETPPQAE
jgi:hypothetical protein